MSQSPPGIPVLAVHGGAGAVARSRMLPGAEAAVHAGLAEALRRGQHVLLAGGSSVEAVQAAVVALEDNPLFNAGRGAVFASDGRIEMDASIMDGKTRAAGAVAGVRRIKNPIRAAHAVMLQSPHVLLAGEGAEAFAIEAGIEMVDPAYFETEHRRAQLDAARQVARISLDHDEAARPLQVDGGKTGTVGAVALDKHGNLAAATSTGGMTNKRPGRIGDSPIVGAGTWAENRVVAVSCTGTGEAFIRAVAAYEVAALMKYRGADILAAAEEVALRTVVTCGGRGGLIAVGADGRVAMPYSTEGMFRGVVRGGGDPETAIHENRNALR